MQVPGWLAPQPSPSHTPDSHSSEARQLWPSGLAVVPADGSGVVGDGSTGVGAGSTGGGDAVVGGGGEPQAARARAIKTMRIIATS